MCTYVDEIATEKYRKRLEKSKQKGLAWKVVVYQKDNPMPFSFFRYMGGLYFTQPPKSYYSANNEIPKMDRAELPDRYDSFGKGVFHLCITRGNARKILKWVNEVIEKDSIFDGMIAKVERVTFDVKDFVAMGHSSSGDKKVWGFSEGPDAICVHEFCINSLCK